MPQDAFTLNVLSKELSALLTGGKVNRITQPTADEIYLNIYAGKNYKLIISANVFASRVSLSSAEKENPISALNFCMLLRKHLLGATILSVKLLDFERIINITFNSSDEFFGSSEKVLAAEIMGKYSNIILTEKGLILGAAKSANLDIAVLRPLLTGMAYQNPPKQDKILASDKTLVDKLLGFSGNLGDFIFENIKGLAKNTAYEIVNLYFHNTVIDNINKVTAEKFSDFLADFVFNPQVKPNATESDFFVFDYALEKGEKKFFDTVYDAEEFFYKNKEGKRLFKDKKSRLLGAVSSEEKKFKKRLNIINIKEDDCKDLDTDRIKGELLISNGYKIASGASEVFLENYYDSNNAKMKILLDKNLSVNANAQKYFKKYNKQKRTLLSVSPQKQEVLGELKYLETIKTEIDLVTNTDDFKDIEEELIVSGILKSKEIKSKKKEKPMSSYEYIIDGFSVKIGKNNVQNDKITHDAKSKDLWLHTKTYHSAHGIIEYNGKEFSERVIKLVAEIIAYYSGGRNGTKIEVDYTLKKFVKKPTGAKLGFVVYTDFKTVLVTPDKREEFLKSR